MGSLHLFPSVYSHVRFFVATTHFRLGMRRLGIGMMVVFMEGAMGLSFVLLLDTMNNYVVFDGLRPFSRRRRRAIQKLFLAAVLR